MRARHARTHGGALALAVAAAWLTAVPAGAQPASPAAYRVVGDAIAEKLPATEAGDAQRGRAIVANRQVGLCLLCHSGPFPEVEFQGDLAPSLAGAGARWSEAQLRLRIADSRALNPQTIMPSYFRADGLSRVGAAWRERTVLTAQQVEDVVAFLRTLRE
jgi:sulfur-oxidizing protein SoxX